MAGDRDLLPRFLAFFQGCHHARRCGDGSTVHAIHLFCCTGGAFRCKVCSCCLCLHAHGQCNHRRGKLRIEGWFSGIPCTRVSLQLLVPFFLGIAVNA